MQATGFNVANTEHFSSQSIRWDIFDNIVVIIIFVVPSVHKMIKHNLKNLASFVARFLTCIRPFCLTCNFR